MKKKLKAWSEQPSYLHRKYFFCTNQQLKDCILEFDGRASVTGNKDALLDCVANCERKSVRRNSMRVNDEDPFAGDDEVDPLLLDILKASKMKPLGDDAKKYCREGHLLERPFLEQFHQHSQDGITCGYKAIAIHETPVGKFYSIDSIDVDMI